MECLHLNSNSIINRTLVRYNLTGNIEYLFCQQGRNKLEEEYPELPEKIKEIVTNNRILD